MISKVEVFCTIVDPKLIEIKNPARALKGRVHQYLKPGAPKAPVGRFSYRWGVVIHDDGAPSPTVIDQRSDGNLIVYHPQSDNCNWVPARTMYGGAGRHLNHPNETLKQLVARALGFPDCNPGYNTQACSCGAGQDCAACRVEKGLYKTVLEAARAWQREWSYVPVTENPIDPSQTKAALRAAKGRESRKKKREAESLMTQMSEFFGDEDGQNPSEA